MSDQDPKPVLVPILPRFDSEGRPSCGGCPICNNDWELGTACNGFFSAQETVQDISHSRPGPKCPIHNPQEQQEPL